jgi:hypothetical protein
MTIDLLQTVQRALDEKWDKPEVLRLLLLGMLDHVEGMERRAAERSMFPPFRLWAMTSALRFENAAERRNHQSLPCGSLRKAASPLEPMGMSPGGDDWPWRWAMRKVRGSKDGTFSGVNNHDRTARLKDRRA